MALLTQRFPSILGGGPPDREWKGGLGARGARGAGIAGRVEEGTLGHAGWRPYFSQISNKEDLGKGFGSGLIGEAEQEFDGGDDKEIPNQHMHTRTHSPFRHEPIHRVHTNQIPRT